MTWSRGNSKCFRLQAERQCWPWLLGILSLTNLGAAQTNCFPAPSGLVSFWPGDGDALDIAGANNGILQGGASASAPGLVSSAFSFSGTNSFVQVPDSPSLQLTNLTIETWVRFDSLDSQGSDGLPTGAQVLVWKSNSAGLAAYGLQKARTGNGDVLTFSVSDPFGQTVAAQSSTLVASNVWYHVAGVRDTNSVQLFVNGVLENSVAVGFAQDNSGSPLYFGASGIPPNGNNLQGSLDEVSLYNRALLPDEIAAIFTAGSTGKCKGPSIIVQPANQMVLPGSDVLLSVAATGLSPLAYQWKLDGSNVSGATAPVLALTNVQPPNVGPYSVVVTNSIGSTTSEVALVAFSVRPAIAYSNQPTSVVVEAGGTATFSVGANGTPPLAYQWIGNGTSLTDDGRISGAASAVLQISCVGPADAGLYRVVITNLAGAAFSASATLTVVPGVSFADPQLYEAVRCAVGKTNCAALTSLDVQTLSRLDAVRFGITNLAGLELATNLKDLSLTANGISDLSPLQQLFQLTRLDLAHNQIVDLSPIGSLTNLSSFSIGGNPLTNFVTLAAFGSLASLSIDGGALSDLSPLISLSGLTALNVRSNVVTDISPLALLTNLNQVDLSWNPVQDLTILGQLTNLTQLRLAGISLSNIVFVSNLPQLTFLSLEHNQVSDLSPLALLTSLDYLVLSGNPITNYDVLSGLSGLVNLELRGNAITNVSFLSSLSQLLYVDLADNQLRDLSPLSTLTNLNLVLDANTNIDYGTLSSLKGLLRVWLDGNSLDNPAFLKDLPQLKALGLQNNQLNDIRTLSGLTNLEYLGLSKNFLSSLDPLMSLTNLTSLRLDDSSILDPGFLTNFPQLISLSLSHNLISDPSSLSSLAQLSSLYLSGNRLTNIDSLVSLPRLQSLDVSRCLLDPGPGSDSNKTADMLRNQCGRTQVSLLPADELNIWVFLPTCPDWYIPAGRASTLGFYVFDAVVPPEEWLFEGSSSDQTVIPDGLISFSGSDNNLFMTVYAFTPSTLTNTLTVFNAPGGISVSTNLIVHVLAPDPAFNISDSNLVTLVSGALGIPTERLTSVDLLELTRLRSSARGLFTLSGLEWATNLTSLELTRGSVTNIAALQKLNALTSLNLHGNLISDISALAGLTNLLYLDLGDNRITDLTPLSGLTGLKYLNLDGNLLTNFSVFSSLPNIGTLLLGDNYISDLNFLTNLPQLTSLELATNRITDLSPLVVLTNLSSAYLYQNRLVDITPLVDLPALSYVDLRFNLLDLNANPAIDALDARQVFLLDLPQRGSPTIDARTNWVIAPQSTSPLFFNVWDNGPVDQDFAFGVDSASAALELGLTSYVDAFGRTTWELIATNMLGSSQITSLTLWVTNDVGFSTNLPITVLVTDFIPLSAAFFGDSVGGWTSGGDAPWFGQTIIARNGHPSAESGSIGNNQTSWLQTTLHGPGRLIFWWKVSSEISSDWLEFSVAGQTNRISGEVDWLRQVVNIPPGNQTLIWLYHKNTESDSGLDAAWLADVSFAPGIWLELAGPPVNGSCQLTLHAFPFRFYQVQAATNDLSNPISWVGLTPPMLVTNLAFPFIDTNAGTENKFYRLFDTSP